MDKVKLELDILPPSVNHAYIHIKSKSGRLFKVRTKQAKDFEKYVTEKCSELNIEPTDKKVKMSIVYTFPDRRLHDLDNTGKIIFDSLEGNFYTNDNNIQELHLYKKYEKGKPKVEIEMEVL